MKRAVFIDRDGTISEEVGYVNHPSRFRVFPYSADAMIHKVHERLKEELKSKGAYLDAIYYCAHHPALGEAPYRFDCYCRKPKPGLIRTAVKDLDINLNGSWMIGDRYSDIELAQNAGTNSAFVMSGYGRGEWEHQRGSWQHQPDLISENLFH